MILEHRDSKVAMVPRISVLAPIHFALRHNSSISVRRNAQDVTFLDSDQEVASDSDSSSQVCFLSAIIPRSD